MKNNIPICFKLVTIILFSSLHIIFFNSCEKVSEKASEKLIEKSIGKDADVDIDNDKVTIKTEEGTFTTDATANSWPNNIPEDIPEFSHGKILSINTQEMEEGHGWMIVFEQVSKTALIDYQKTLKNKGFKIINMTTYGEGGMLNGQKDNSVITLISGDGNATLSISVEK